MRTWPSRIGLFALTMGFIVLIACQTSPKIRTQTAPGANLSGYSTYGYFEKVGTDKNGYATITTRYIEDAIDREMTARGFTRSDNPDVLVNFHVATRDKVRSSPGASIGLGYGGWRHGYGWGLGLGDRGDVETVTDGTLTVDLVDRGKNELVWSGSAVGRLTEKILDHPQPAIDGAVKLIFARYPKPAAGA